MEKNKEEQIKSFKRIGWVSLLVGFLVRLIIVLAFRIEPVAVLIGNIVFWAGLISCIVFYRKAKKLENGNSKSAFDKLDAENANSDK